MKKIILSLLMIINLISVLIAQENNNKNNKLIWNYKKGDPFGVLVYPMLIETDNNNIINTYYCIGNYTYVSIIINNNMVLYSGVPFKIDNIHINCEDFEKLKDKIKTDGSKSKTK